MKPPAHNKRRLIVRIKPGGILQIPLLFLRRSGWRLGDIVICEVAGDRIHLCKPLTETTWCIERLRRRLNRGGTDDSAGFAAHSYSEYRWMTMQRQGFNKGSSRSKPDALRTIDTNGGGSKR